MRWRRQKRSIWLAELDELPWAARLRFSVSQLWGIGHTRALLEGRAQAPLVSPFQMLSVALAVGLVAVAVSLVPWATYVEVGAPTARGPLLSGGSDPVEQPTTQESDRAEVGISVAVQHGSIADT